MRLNRDREDQGEEMFKIQSSGWNPKSKDVKKKKKRKDYATYWSFKWDNAVLLVLVGQYQRVVPDILW